MKVKRFWNEKWAPVVTPIPTKKCLYEISNLGRIISTEKATGVEKLLKGSYTKVGYHQLNLRLADGSYFRHYIHLFVAKTFMEKTNEDQVFVTHKDRDRSNNAYTNLLWISKKDLIAQQMKRGQFDYNRRKPSKLIKMTESKVKLLKSRVRKGKTKRKILAKQFGISEMQISRIMSGENWGHVD